MPLVHLFEHRLCLCCRLEPTWGPHPHTSTCLEASDTKAFRGVPLLDMLPNGCVVTMITVLILHTSFKKMDKALRRRSIVNSEKPRHSRSYGDSTIAAVKTTTTVLWFLLCPCATCHAAQARRYCLVFGALFFAGSAYPHFLGFLESAGFVVSSSARLLTKLTRGSFEQGAFESSWGYMSLKLCSRSNCKAAWTLTARASEMGGGWRW